MLKGIALSLFPVGFVPLNPMNPYDLYEPVIGLEVHAQLLTKTKAYCGDPALYGAMPNTQVSPVSLGHPGTLPFFNREVLRCAVRLGLAVGSEIRELNGFARKNYFYADLPKGYQITQDKTPICEGGKITIRINGTEKVIGLIRIHMEEDAGKSIHDVDPFHTLVDLNRAGVPLLEMVSAPDLRSPDEAYQYLTEVRKLLRYLDICDGNMEEGSMRCDANISVRLKGTTVLNTRVEIKNMNSIRNVQRAIEGEVKRQIDVIEAGGKIDQETRTFDASTGKTIVLRSKEMANDYRYFPEPDLNPVRVSKAFVASVEKEMPPLPDALLKKYTGPFGLSEYDALVLIDQKEIALYFEKLLALKNPAKSSANWLMGPVKSYLNERALEIDSFPLRPEKLSALMQLVESGTISFSAAAQKIFPLLCEQPDAQPNEIAEQLNLIQESDDTLLITLIQQVLDANPVKVEEYRKGKKGLSGMFMGEVMKLSGGKADPKKTNKLLTEALEKTT